jgi:hypothetical protein
LKNVPGITIIHKADAELNEDIEKGRIIAVINIQKNTAPTPAYIIDIKSAESVSPQNLQVLKSIINSIIANINSQHISKHAYFCNHYGETFKRYPEEPIAVLILFYQVS